MTWSSCRPPVAPWKASYEPGSLMGYASDPTAKPPSVPTPAAAVDQSFDAVDVGNVAGYGCQQLGNPAYCTELTTDSPKPWHSPILRRTRHVGRSLGFPPWLAERLRTPPATRSMVDVARVLPSARPFLLINAM